KKATKAIREAFPHLEIDELSVVTRFRDNASGKVVIDLMKSDQGVFRAAFRHTHKVEAEGQEFLIPSLEMAIAMKFAPMVSPNRPEEDRYQDAHDFMHMVKTNPVVDSKVLQELGEMVYPGGGEEILEMVRRVREGKKLNL
ncbi:MAG TPA: hypothetical protein VGP68_02595, partial [Gemmataceae bacterium]|nr:hypothetical protein [Gemmataceae bacterium]